ncbi:tetratricopeptide repeat protein [bacterium]|nr:tetratricopeptide repeat protein [bacterium]
MERFPGGAAGLLLLGLTVAAVLAVYAQSLGFGMVNYDDALVNRPEWRHLRELSWDGVKRIFSLHEGGAYQPLRDLAFALVWRLQGAGPFGFHLFNLLFYGLNLAAVFVLLRRLLGLTPGFEAPRTRDLYAWAGTLLFAVHPVHVEAVAWVVANKELLCGLFCFLSFHAWLRSREAGHSRLWYALALLFFLLGLLSKPTAAALPLALAVFELLNPGAAEGERHCGLLRRMARLAPFAAPVALAGLYYVFRSTAFTGSFLQDSLRVHILSLASVLAKYVRIVFLPVNLCNSYPPPFFSGRYDWRLAAYLALDTALFWGLWLSVRRGERMVSFGLAFFLLTLLPVSGLLPISIFMADRYLYLPSFGAVLAGLVLLRRLEQSSPARRRILVAAGALVLAALTVLSTARCRAWRDGVSLWGSAARTYPNFQFNFYGLGATYMQLGRDDEALDAFRVVNSFKEHLRATLYSGQIYERRGDSLAARQAFRRSVELYGETMGKPELLAEAWRGLGRLDSLAALAGRASDDRDVRGIAIREADRLFASGDWSAAAILYGALPVRYLDAERLERLAAGCYASGRYTRALDLFRALRDSSAHPTAAACNNVGVALEALDSLQAAQSEYSRALELDPRYPDALFNLGNVARKQGRPAQALQCYDRALALEGSRLDVELARGLALLDLGRGVEAASVFEWVLKARPGASEALLGLADALWQSGRRDKASEIYRRCDAAMQNPPSRVLERRGRGADVSPKN